MPKWQYALEPDGKKSLQVSTGQLWGNTELRLNGELIGTITTRKELTAGKAFELQDGTVLQVQRVNNELRILRNNVPVTPVTGGASDPSIKIAMSSVSMYILGVINILLGCIAYFLQVEYLQTIHYGIISIVVGCVFVLLGILIRSRLISVIIVALVVSSVYLVIMLIVGVLAALEHAENTVESAIRGLVIGEALKYGAIPIGIFAGSVVLLVAVGKGVGAIKKLKEETPPTVL